jgi:hypothetical protein
MKRWRQDRAGGGFELICPTGNQQVSRAVCQRNIVVKPIARRNEFHLPIQRDLGRPD